MLSGGDSLIKVSTDVWAQALGISGVNFCPGIRFWELNFAQALGFWQFLTKEYVIFDKRVKKVIYRCMYLKTPAKVTFCIKSQGHVSDENFLY